MNVNLYSEIGDLLKRQRETMHLSVEQAARLLHIRARYLVALEQGSLDDIPGLTYTRGYLQSYAGFLGLDKEEILRRFEQVEGLLAKKGFYFPEVFSREKNPPRWALWGGAMVALLAYLGWAVAFQPERRALSRVESPPVLVQATSSMPVDVACLYRQETVYPLCGNNEATSEHFSLLPLRGQLHTIMELAP